MFDPRTVLLTYEDVIRLRDERDQVGHEIDELNAKYDSLNERFEAICTILPEEARKHILGGPAHSGDSKTNKDERFYERWEAVIMPMLQETGHGLTTGGIRKRVEGQPIEELVGFQGRTLYRAINKLVERGLLFRDGDYYLLPGQDKPSVEEEVSLFAVFSKAILEYLSDKFTPLGGRAIMDGLSNTEIGPTLSEKQTYFYNVLSRLVSEGRLKKDGRTYIIPQELNAPPDRSSTPGPDIGSVFE